ncbi:hypothetical protein RJ55_01266 [Drechmeria coniospora]|nr:hypothetical protein RJ55_01266 [Drechmeria coniospora]
MPRVAGLALASIARVAGTDRHHANTKGRNKKIKQVDIMRNHEEQVKDTIFHATSLKVDADVRKQRLSLNKALKGHADTLLRHIGKLEDELAAKVCSLGEQPAHASATLEFEHLRKEIADDVKDLQFWSALKTRLPQQELHDNDYGIALGVYEDRDGIVTEEQIKKYPDEMTQRVVLSPNPASLKRATTSGGDGPQKTWKGTNPALHSISASYPGPTIFRPQSSLQWREDDDTGLTHNANVLEPQTKTTGEREPTTINPSYGSAMPRGDESGGTRTPRLQWQETNDWGFRGDTADRRWLGKVMTGLQWAIARPA